MSRFLLLTGITGLLALPSTLTFAAAPDVVQLPTLSVIDQTRAYAPGSPTLISIESGSASTSFSDLARQTAGFSVNDAGARGFGETVTLRGLGNTPYFTDASAPVYLDNIPLATGFTFPSDLYDFTQLSIYRGPQAAALFGRAGDAGVIQFTSAEAGKQATNHIAATVGSYGLSSVTATAQTARHEKFDALVSIGTSQRDGYIENTTLNQSVDERQATFGRAKLQYRPTQDLELSLQVLAQQSRDGAQALVPLFSPLFTVARGKEGYADADFTAVSLGLAKRLAEGTLTATSSYTDWNLSPYANRLVVFGGANFDSALTQSQRTFNEELRYVSERFTGGLIYSHGRTKGGATRSFSGFTIENSRFQLDSDMVALFGQTNFKPSAVWTITPGLRFEYAAKDFQRTEVVPTNAVANLSDNWNSFLPSISATRSLGQNTEAVFTVARGFKAGGYSAYTGRANLMGYDPQRTWGIEAGLSTADPKAHWSFTSRGYAYRVQGYQIERSFAVPATSTDEYLVVNADRARVLGVELESTWQPTPDFTVRAVAGLTNVTLNNFTDPFTGTNYSGNQAPYAPTGNAALRLDYHPDTGFFAGLGATWTGRTYYDEQETAAFSQDSYTLLDGRIGWAFAHGELQLFGRNLNDEAYYSAITPGVFHGTPGAPRTWGVEVNLRW